MRDSENTRHIAAAARSLHRSFASVPAIDKSLILLLCNAMMKSLAQSHGDAAYKNPSRLPEAVRNEILTELSTARSTILQVVKGVSEAVLPSYRKASIRQLRATEVLLLTLGIYATRSKAQRSILMSCWKAMWKERDNLSTGLTVLRAEEKELGTLLIPQTNPRKPYTDKELLDMGSSLPPFLKSRKKT